MSAVRSRLAGEVRDDWHAWSGHDAGVAVPHVPGHEFVGRVAAAGEDVRSLRVGERVITPFVCGCGSCAECRRGDAQVCARQTQPGFTHWGSFAEFVEVRHADFNAIRVPEDADARDLVPLGCRFATAFRALHGRARLEPGEKVAVFGCGGVGLSAVMIAAALGAEVVAIDIDGEALRLASAQGAAHAIDAAGMRPAEVAGEVVARAGAPDATVEALGVPDTAEAALLSLRPGGRHAQIGLFASEPRLPVARIIAQELAFLGSHGMSAADYPPMLRLIENGSLRPRDLITRTIPLDVAPAALMAAGGGGTAGMTVIEP